MIVKKKSGHIKKKNEKMYVPLLSIYCILNAITKTKEKKRERKESEESEKKKT